MFQDLGQVRRGRMSQVKQRLRHLFLPGHHVLAPVLTLDISAGLNETGPSVR